MHRETGILRRLSQLSPQGRKALLVLIADDHTSTREMYAEFLRVSGFRVAEAADGVAAVALARKLHPAVAVIDIEMPRLDGLSAIRRIRDSGPGRRIPILVLTAFDIAEDDARGAGADSVCVKPCMPADLLVQIEHLLARDARVLDA